MALLNTTFILGIAVLLYLSSFLLFAVLRTLTGISIQRIGYFSLRRLAYAPADGVKLELRAFSFNIHRPTFAQPTWLSIVLTEPTITIDLHGLSRGKENAKATRDDVPPPKPSATSTSENLASCLPKVRLPFPRRSPSEAQQATSWDRLLKLKDKVKRLHRGIRWLRMVDVVALNGAVHVNNVGSAQVANFTMTVDTRRKLVDRGRIFSHSRRVSDVRRPAEWKFIFRSILYTPDGGDALEIVDHATLHVHGQLYKNVDGLRDAAIGLKLGRLYIPCDDVQQSIARSRKQWHSTKNRQSPSLNTDDIFVGKCQEDGEVKTDLDNLPEAVNRAREFARSTLRGIKEIQFAVSYMGITKRVTAVHPRRSPVYLNASMKEVGIDLHRLDPKSPAHRMYFSAEDIAHQALIAALSIAIGVDDGDHGKTERWIYVPMATTTIRTTLPSRSVRSTTLQSADERNANILMANMVVTSPSVDLDTKHLPLVLAIILALSQQGSHTQSRRHDLLSRFLPKASVKVSMHEPVLRIALPPVEKLASEDDFDLIISSISSISVDIESSHSAVGELHYALGSTLRLQSQDLYYRTCTGHRLDILQVDSFELKVHVNADPELSVVLSGVLDRFAISMVRAEISDGLRQIIRQVRLNSRPKALTQAPTRQLNFVRAMPPWLSHIHFQAADVSAEIAGLDEEISSDTRGVALQLDSWVGEYRAHKSDTLERHHSRRRASSRSAPYEGESQMHVPASPKRRSFQHHTDGRRLTIHTRGLEAFIVESVERWEFEPFLSIPRSEVAFSTSSDAQGLMLHANSSVRTISIQYSLYRHYSIGVAAMVLRKAFARTKADEKEVQHAKVISSELGSLHARTTPLNSPSRTTDFLSADAAPHLIELVTLDFRSTLVQVKGKMPTQPQVLLQIHGIEAGRHRWSPPFIHAKLVRFCAEAPRMDHVWAKIVSVRALRLDVRKTRKKHHNGSVFDEQMIDITSDAIRLAVPHQLVMHKIFDNIVNTTKAVEQLHHRFSTSTNDYILDKQPVGPRNVPKISLRSKVLLFELEDGAFEWRLGLIYKAGLIEQQQRIARHAAYQAKLKKLEEARRGSTRSRHRSAHAGARNDAESNRRPRSTSEPGRDGSGRRRGRTLRYDPEGTCGFSENTSVSAHEALDGLYRHNAASWKLRIDRALTRTQSAMHDLRTVFFGHEDEADAMEHGEKILDIPQRPALMSSFINDLHVTIDKPSFPMSELPAFLHRVGKGMPYDMQYSLLVPMNIQMDMGEARVTLRDYPLPLLHVPPIKTGQSSRLPSWSLGGDFVIAEEFRGPESIRHAKVEVIPAALMQADAAKSFAIDVRRTVSPVKTYSDLNIDINTAYPTRITWGASYQPAIQDMMMTIETFNKPQVDPSDRIGFWDKIRLGFHSRISVSWKGDGDVHLMLKGTRDPYVVTGNGAGFLMCWRNDVRWNICRDPDPRKFMTVDSGEYILAVPDFNSQAKGSFSHGRDDRASVGFQKTATFKKVIMKLSGNVQWLAGLVFERNKESGGRSFKFRPHYNVVLKEPRFATTEHGKYDAFKEFRSQHIHMSVAVKAPVQSADGKQSKSYNAVHLTPRFFTHFYAWWAMFGGTMSLPIRQGSLWPGVEKSSKKFGRHLATIKYGISLAPLFISHIYKHKDAEDYAEDVVAATGLKMRLDNFMLDLHQRREEFYHRDLSPRTQAKTTGMMLHQAQLDLVSADIRAISASIEGTASDEPLQSDSRARSPQPRQNNPDLSRFDLLNNDFSWVDVDDFVELDWILPSSSGPATKIMPLAFAPRFTYFRQTDHRGSIYGDKERTSTFGKESTHYCAMSEDDDPRRVQCQLIEERLGVLETQIENHVRALGEAELRCIRDEHDTKHRNDFEQIQKHSRVLREKKVFLTAMLQRYLLRVQNGTQSESQSGVDHAVEGDGEPRADEDVSRQQHPTLETHPTAEFASDFNNRFVIHNVHLKWNNQLRNIILRYIHQVSQRRGFVYYLSRRAVKFILDIVDEQGKAKTSAKATAPPRSSVAINITPSSTPNINADVQDVDGMIKEILADGRKFVNAEDPNEDQANKATPKDQDHNDLSDDFLPQNNYHLRLIAPQIQLQSQKNTRSAVLVTAKGMELKVVEVMDKDRVFDNVSGLVQRKFSVEMDSTQFFVSQQDSIPPSLVSLYTGSRYGTTTGRAWPPWVPMETMYNFQTDPLGFKRVVQKTSASLKYDKYNTLRLKYNDEVNTPGGPSPGHDTSESRMDHLWVEFPRIRAICNSAEYYAMYIIVLDLLMYSEPLEKTRSERLEKIMLASDFSDLRGAPAMVTRLQDRIRKLEEIKTLFQVYADNLDEKGWRDKHALDRDLTSCEDELFFIMKAITTSQRRHDNAQSSGLLRWNISSDQIVWHLIRDNNEPLMEFQLQGAEYDRTDNADGSHFNLVSVGRFVGLNLMSDAIYPEMFTPYFGTERGAFGKNDDQKMLRVYWFMLEAIAGIPVMDHFEVNLFPINIQLEREVGKRLFEYIFPSSREHGPDRARSSTNGKSPAITGDVMHSESEEDTVQLRDKKTFWPTKQTDDETNPRTGSLELRLQPTLNSEVRPSSGHMNKPKSSSVHSFGQAADSPFRLFGSGPKETVHGKPSSSPYLSTKPSDESLGGATLSRSALGRSATNLSKSDAGSNGTESKSKLFGMRRTEAKSRNKSMPSDDLTKMMARASNYMTLAYVKIPSVVLCLSFKGKGDRNIEDVHNFVFRLPLIEYRNKTWSNLDLALALKKDIIRALISHTGAIIGNKFSKHRPNSAQQSRLRQVANSSVLMSPSIYASSRESSDASSSNISPTDVRDDRPRSPRRSLTSSLGSNNDYAASVSSSTKSSHTGAQSVNRANTFPASLMMTPARDASTAAGDARHGSLIGEQLFTSPETKSTGFMASTLGKLKKKDKDGASPVLGAQGPDTEDPKRKHRHILGMKLGSNSTND